MKSIQASPLLKFALVADAVVSAAVALLQLAGGAALAELLALPRPLLAWSGEFLVVYALLLALLARARTVPRAMIFLLIVGNLGWAIGCAELLIGSWTATNGLGAAFILVQALAVLLFAALEYAGLKRSSPLAATPQAQAGALHR